MRILSITAQKPHSTGSGTYLTELVRNFAAAGCEQAVVAGIYPDDVVDFPDGVKFYPVYFKSSEDNGEENSGAPCQVSFPIVGMSDLMPYESTRYRDMTAPMIEEFEEAFVEAIRRAVSELEPDIVICHHLFLLTSIVRKHFPELTMYGICHGTCLRQMRNAAAAKAAEQRGGGSSSWAISLRDINSGISSLNRVFALHEPQAIEISKTFDINPYFVTVIGSGYNPDLFHPAAEPEERDKVGIIYAGKISTPKGIPELLTVLESLKSRNIKMTFVGGCQEPELMAQLEELKEAAAEDDAPLEVEIMEPVPQSELAELYRQNDILVLPSYFEGLSLVPIEAMASGLIPVCTDLPGMRNWINENVTNPNVRYVPMPEMATIDHPTESGRQKYIEDLLYILTETIEDIEKGKQEMQPDTSGISWQEVSKKIISH